MSITFTELQHGHLISDIPLDAQHNMEVLLVSINKLRDDWGKPMVVTSGFRTAQDQKNINASAPNSKHCKGQAVDIADPDGKLYQYVWELDKNNRQVLKDYGLWFEQGTSRMDGHGWIHCQCVPYGSYVDGKSRFFIP